MSTEELLERALAAAEEATALGHSINADYKIVTDMLRQAEQDKGDALDALRELAHAYEADAGNDSIALTYAYAVIKRLS